MKILDYINNKKQQMQDFFDKSEGNYFLKKSNKELTPEIEEKLDKASIMLFPTNGSWYYSCYRKPKALNKEYLPCHLRDTDWLAGMLKQDANAMGIPLNVIKKYINTSPVFEQLRHNYELRVVRWQIDWIQNGGHNWIVPEGHSQLGIFETDFDTRLRGGVIKTLTAIGMEPDVIEEGLEKFSDMWRRRQMELSFNSRYEPMLLSFTRKYDKLPPSDEEFKSAWIDLREYEYYDANQNAVDRYGKPTPAMLMLPEEYFEKEDFVKQKSDERLAFIEHFKKHNYVNLCDEFEQL